VPREGPIKILALGDTGKGTPAQRRVARAAEAQCAAEGGCHLGVLLGDNLYPSGMKDVDDPRFDEIVEDVYGRMPFPFLMVLGNHDYGSPWSATFIGGLGLEENRAKAQIARVARSERLFMPGRHWRVDFGRLEIVGIDTPSLMFHDAPALAGPLNLIDDAEEQDRNLLRWNLEARAPFRLAIGHHPYRSAGVHGDAGRYEGIPIDGLIFGGRSLKRFFEKRILGHFDVYLAGHDHGMQDAGDERGTALFVSGGGAEHRPHPARSPVPFAAASLGFVVLDVDPEAGRAHARIFGLGDDERDVAPVLLHERRIIR
jgi:tartrate-resistant acid phosphatase type 5